MQVNFNIGENIAYSLSRLDSYLEEKGVLPKLEPPPPLTQAQGKEFAKVGRCWAGARAHGCACHVYPWLVRLPGREAGGVAAIASHPEIGARRVRVAYGM